MSTEDSSAQSQKVWNSAVETAAARRERMILEQMPQVRLIALRFHCRLAEKVYLEDLVSSGTLGLIAAIDNFRESRGVKLRTYSEHKIRGAIDRQPARPGLGLARRPQKSQRNGSRRPQPATATATQSHRRRSGHRKGT
ncbi:MAG: sigma factor [Bryobacteraceae bacterium]|jgi:DNA-directed RNA polymerase specialized sigma subunit